MLTNRAPFFGVLFTFGWDRKGWTNSMFKGKIGFNRVKMNR